jgi:hypothetical protein
MWRPNVPFVPGKEALIQCNEEQYCYAEHNWCTLIVPTIEDINASIELKIEIILYIKELLLKGALQYWCKMEPKVETSNGSYIHLNHQLFGF